MVGAGVQAIYHFTLKDKSSNYYTFMDVYQQRCMVVARGLGSGVYSIHSLKSFDTQLSYNGSVDNVKNLVSIWENIQLHSESIILQLAV